MCARAARTAASRPTDPRGRVNNVRSADVPDRLRGARAHARRRARLPTWLVCSWALMHTGDSIVRQLFVLLVADQRGLAPAVDHHFHKDALYPLRCTAVCRRAARGAGPAHRPRLRRHAQRQCRVEHLERAAQRARLNLRARARRRRASAQPAAAEVILLDPGRPRCRRAQGRRPDFGLSCVHTFARSVRHASDPCTPLLLARL